MTGFTGVAIGRWKEPPLGHTPGSFVGGSGRTGALRADRGGIGLNVEDWLRVQWYTVRGRRYAVGLVAGERWPALVDGVSPLLERITSALVAGGSVRRAGSLPAWQLVDDMPGWRRFAPLLLPTLGAVA